MFEIRDDALIIICATKSRKEEITIPIKCILRL